MVNRCTTCLILTGLVAWFALDSVYGELTKSDKGKILVKVNGVPLYENNLYLGMPHPPGSVPGMEQYKDSMLQEAIKQELLYQEAKKQGLDKDPSYKETLNQMEKQAQEFEVESLARFFESVDEELQKARSQQQVSEEDISAFYQEDKEHFSKMPEAQAKDSIRKILESQKYVQAYNSYIKNIVAKAEVKVNGKPLPKDVLTASMESYTPSFPPSTSPGEQKEVLFPKVSELAAGKEAKSDADVRKSLQNAVVTIGKSSFRLGDCYQLSMILSPPADMPSGAPQFNRDLPLFMVLKNHILAEEAKKAGLDKDPRWVSQKESMASLPFIPGHLSGGAPMMAVPGENQEQRILVNLLIQKLGLYDYEKIQVSQEEVDQYYEKNQARYKKLTPDKAKSRVIRQLRYEKASQKMNEYIDNLRKSAKIEILEQTKE